MSYSSRATMRGAAVPLLSVLLIATGCGHFLPKKDPYPECVGHRTGVIVRNESGRDIDVYMRTNKMKAAQILGTAGAGENQFRLLPTTLDEHISFSARQTSNGGVVNQRSTRTHRSQSVTYKLLCGE